MMLENLVFAQAALLAGELDGHHQALLRVLCQGAVAVLGSRLREGLTPEDCKADFVAAASLYALSSLNSAEDTGKVEEFKAGDLTVKQGAASLDAASRCLERQAEQIIRPYLKDSFSFQGV